jgi:hypothetical protein
MAKNNFKNIAKIGIPLNNAKIQAIIARTKYILAGVQSFLNSFI